MRGPLSAHGPGSHPVRVDAVRGAAVRNRRNPLFLPGVLLFLVLPLFAAACGSDSDSTGPAVDPDECTMPSNPSPVFTRHLTDLSLHSTIHPMGAAWGGYIHDNGHTYLQIGPDQAGSPVPVYAPVDMRIERILQHRSPDGQHIDWAMTFRVSCEVWIIMTHINDPVPAVRDLWSGPPASSSAELQFLPQSEWLHVSAGDSLGNTTGTSERSNWDFGVYHTDHYNEFINPARHVHPQGRSEFSRALNSVCPYPFFTPSLRSQYEAMFGSILTDQPEPGAHCRQGSRDVPGTAAGSWFRVSGDPAFYGPVGGMGSEFGGHVIFGGIGPGGFQTIMETTVLPEDVTTEHCWHQGGDWIYLRVNPDEILHAALGSGDPCPGAFPESGYAVYER
jgi:hypothetical protein